MRRFIILILLASTKTVLSQDNQIHPVIGFNIGYSNFDDQSAVSPILHAGVNWRNFSLSAKYERFSILIGPSSNIIGGVFDYRVLKKDMRFSPLIRLQAGTPVGSAFQGQPVTYENQLSSKESIYYYGNFEKVNYNYSGLLLLDIAAKDFFFHFGGGIGYFACTRTVGNSQLRQNRMGWQVTFGIKYVFSVNK